MKKNGAVYIRVSTDRQEELSPDAQKRLLLEYAENHGIHISDDHIFQDNGISGRKAEKRPAFQDMIAHAKSKEHPFDCIIVWKYSRFARNQEESILYKSLLKKVGVDVISISENTDGEFGTLIERIIEWMDEYYSIRLSGEVMRGMTQNAMRGHYQSDPPIGYKSVSDGPPVIDPETKDIPVMIKDMFLSGKKPIDIARHLNAMGYHTKRGNLYDVRGVKYILSNPFYCGISRWNYTERGRKLKPEDEVIYSKGEWEPLWDEDIYQQIQTMLKSQARTCKKRELSSCKHWLSGILRCSACGRTLSYTTQGSYTGFQCWAYGKGICSESHYVGRKNAEQSVINGLKILLSNQTIPYKTVHVEDRSNEVRLEDLNKELSRLKKKESRAREAYLDGIDTKDEYMKSKKYIQSSIGKIEKEISDIENYTPDPDELAKMDEMMRQNIKSVIEILEDESIGYAVKGEAIRKIVDYIVYDRKENTYDFSLHMLIN